MKVIRYVLVWMLLVILSCDDGEDKGIVAGKLAFRFAANDIGRLSADFAPQAILISIETTSGNPVAELLRMELYSFSGAYLTNQSLELLPGQYKITELLVVDHTQTVTHVLPLEGSLYADLVEDAAPIYFTLENGAHLVQSIQVVKVEGSAADYGYATFVIEEVPMPSTQVSVNFDGSGVSIHSAEVRFTNSGNSSVKVASLNTMVNNYYGTTVSLSPGDWEVEMVIIYDVPQVNTWYGNPVWWSDEQPGGTLENLGAYKYKKAITVSDSPMSVEAANPMSSDLWTDYFYKAVLPEQKVQLFFNKISWEDFLEVEVHPSVDLKYLYLDKVVYWGAYDGSEHMNESLHTWSACDQTYPYGGCDEVIDGRKRFTFSLPKTVKHNDINCHDMFFYYEQVNVPGDTVSFSEGLTFCTDQW